MREMLPAFLFVLLAFPVFAQQKEMKPDIPIEKWTGKTVILIGAHADDDQLSHGTLAMLQAHGNQVYVLTLTTGNVGTQDPNLSRTQLAQIRRQEELAALAELGIPGGHYINLGYDDPYWSLRIARQLWKISFDGFASCVLTSFLRGTGQELPTLA